MGFTAEFNSTQIGKTQAYHRVIGVTTSFGKGKTRTIVEIDIWDSRERSKDPKGRPFGSESVSFIDVERIERVDGSYRDIGVKGYSDNFEGAKFKGDSRAMSYVALKSLDRFKDAADVLED